MKVFKHKKFVTLQQLENFANSENITVVNVNMCSDYTYHWIMFYYKDVGNLDYNTHDGGQITGSNLDV